MLLFLFASKVNQRTFIIDIPNPVPLAAGFIFSPFPLAVPDKFPIFAVQNNT